jgi:hypothetical protein
MWLTLTSLHLSLATRKRAATRARRWRDFALCTCGGLAGFPPARRAHRRRRHRLTLMPMSERRPAREVQLTVAVLSGCWSRRFVRLRLCDVVAVMGGVASGQGPGASCSP